MLLPAWFIYIAAALRLSGGIAYLGATLKGKAKPNPVIWLIWSIVPLATFFAGITTGVGTEMVITLAAGISPLLIFFAAIHKSRRSFRLDRLSLTCLAVATTGIVLWPITGNPEIAISVLMLSDLLSSLPIIIKAWKQPKSEFPPTYLISSISMAIALMTMTEWRIASVAYPLYSLSANLVIFALSRHNPRRKSRKKSSKARR